MIKRRLADDAALADGTAKRVKKSGKDRWASDSEEDGEVSGHAKRKGKHEATKDIRILPSEADPVKPPSASKPASHHNPFLYGCRNVSAYKKVARISEGTYGIVWKAEDKVTGELVALKEVKMGMDVCKEGFPLAALREIGVLLELKHPNIIQVREMVVGDSNEEVYMAMEFMEHDLKVLLRTMKHPFTTSEIKCLMKQLLEAVAFMHERWYIHRDLKTSNLLLNNKGTLVVCDFGLARKYGEPVRPYTPLVVTLVYRAPELLLGVKSYGTALDMWSVGVIFAELFLRDLLFKVDSELGLLDAMFRLLGSPSEETWPGFTQLPNAVNIRWSNHYRNRLRELFPESSITSSSPLSKLGLDLMSQLLCMNPDRRISAAAALEHPWFKEAPVAKPMEEMRAFPPTSLTDMEELDRTPEEDWRALFNKGDRRFA